MRLSLRTLSVGAALLLGLIILFPAAGLYWMSRVIEDAMQDIEHAMRPIVLSAEIERRIWEYQSIADMWLATRDEGYRQSSAEIDRELRWHIAQLAEHTGNTGAHLRLARSVEAFLTERRRLDELDLPLDEVLPSVRPYLEAAATDVASVRARTLEEHRAAEEDARLAIERATSLIAVPIVFLVFAFATLVVLGRYLVAQPILHLQESIRRFRGGSEEARASEEGVVDLRALAATFNDMAATIVRQRREQLTVLAGIAHDLRTPLSALKMGFESLDEEEARLDPAARRLIRRQIDRLNRMVGDVLDTARIEAGHLEVMLDNLDLREPARAMVDLYGPTTDSHDITAEVGVEPAMVRGDRQRIEQVLSNLLANAIKYSPAGGSIIVMVQVHETEAELSVADRGEGIPSEEIDDLFVPFRRPKRKGEASPGAGLGLSIVRRIVAAHGGRIEVDSTPGLGSTFRLFFPLIPDRAP